MKNRTMLFGLKEFRYVITNSCTWTVPKGCIKIEVLVVGGGGAGGQSGHGSGGGGGGGQVVVSTLDVTPGNIYNVVIGKGGTNALNSSPYQYADGGSGTQSSFGNIVANGGDGGKGSKSHQMGLGGLNYTKGGNGGRPQDLGLILPTPGVNGTLYDGDYYGSSGGAGGANGGGRVDPGTSGGVNAGHGFTSGDQNGINVNYPLAVPNKGAGGGSSNGGALPDGKGGYLRTESNGSDGVVIIKGLRQESI